MKNKIKKFLSFFTAIVITLGVIIPSASFVHAETTLEVAKYTKTSGVVTGATASNNGTYEGKWTAEIPMGKVLAGIENEMKQAATNGWYPHGKDGKNKIAYIEYKVTFPEGVTIDNSNITTDNTTSMFNKAAFTYTVNGQVVTFKFPLRDENWAGIYKHYKDDGGVNSDKKISLSIPYTVKATSLDEAKALETKNITAKGDFETHPSGRFYAFQKFVYNTDISTKSLATDFSKSDVFVKPTNIDFTKSVNIDADILIAGDTGNNTIVKQKTDEIDFEGVIKAKTIKDQMAAIEASHQGANANDIKLENLDTHFYANLTLPEGLDFTKSEATLTGSNGSFEIEEAKFEGKTAKVKFKLVGAENINSFAKLKEAINKVDDELKVTFKTAKFSDSAQSDTDYEVTGSVQGNLKAKATHTVTGNVINFNLSWNGIQTDAGKSNSNPNAIAISVKYLAPTEDNISAVGNLEGDLLVNGDTQHDKVYEANKNDSLTLTGLLNVTPIKKQLKDLENTYPASGVATNIKVENATTSFTAKMTLPEELKFADDYTVELAGANGKFKISEQKVEGKTITVTLTVAENIKTFKEVKEAVEGVDNELKVNVKGVKFDTDKAKANTNYTINGIVSGNFKAKATHVLSGKVINFDYTWNGVQLAEGEDSTDPTTKDIKLTVKYLAPTEENISAVGNLEGDLLVNGDTQHDKVYEANKNDSLTMTGLLNVTPIKNQLKDLENTYAASGVATNIKVENATTSFTAKMTLPEELKFADDYTVELAGANGKFKISEQKVEGKTITVTLTVAENIKTFKEVKEAVEGVDNELKVNVKGVKFDTDKAIANTNYTINGTVSGNFKAKATHILSGKVINFDYTWNGVQLAGGEDSTNPTTKDIKLTVKYVKNNENVFEATQKLLGDILVGNETEHDKVFEVEKDAKVAFTGSLDVSPVKKQMKEIEEQFNRTNVDPKIITISEYSSTFTAKLTLPEEMDFDGNPQVSLLNDNGKYKIVSSNVNGKTIEVVMTVNKEVNTFADLKDAVNGMEDKLNVVVNGAKFNNKASENTNYTVKGTMTGELKAKAKDTRTGSVLNFKLNWEAEQLPQGADAINPTSKDITFTLKYVSNEQPVVPPVVPPTPETPWTPMIPSTRNLKVTKKWLGTNGNKITVPVDKIEVELYKDGKATGQKLELNKANSWTGEFKDLKAYESIENSKAYEYTVKEVGENNNSIKLGNKLFKVTYSGNMKDGIEVVNTESPALSPSIPSEKPKKSKLAKTGIGASTSIYSGILAISGGIMLFLKKRNQK